MPPHPPEPELPDFELPPDNRPRWFLFALVLLAAIGVAAYFLYQVDARHKIAVAAIPARDEAKLAQLPEIFRTRLADAERRVRDGHGQEAVEALAGLARLYQANGFSKEASQIHPALIRLDPKDARWPFLQAVLLADGNRIDEALPFFENARALAPNRIALRLRLADALLQKHQNTRAAALCNSVIADDPGNLHAILGLARADIAAQNWPAARAQLQLAAGLRPDCAEPWNLLAAVREKLGEPAAAQIARDRAKKARALPPPSDDWLESLADDCYDARQIRAAASLARLSGDSTRARTLLERALSFAPDDAGTHRELGELLAALGPENRKSARAHLQFATEHAPHDAAAWAALMAFDNDAGDTRAALDDALLALAYCPKSPAVRREYARALKAAGEDEAARFQLQEAQRLDGAAADVK